MRVDRRAGRAVTQDRPAGHRGSIRRAMAALLAVAGVVWLLGAAGDAAASTRSSAAAAVPTGICYRGHLHDLGWQAWRCNGGIAGTVGQSRRLEALQIRQYGAGTLCANAHVQNTGLQGSHYGRAVTAPG
jgi:uncharacterized protein YjdB